MAKPKVTTNPVANNYAGPNERIVEYSTRSGLGGLIAFRETDDGLTVDLYRHDEKVAVRVGKPDGAADEGQNLFVGLFKAVAECEAPSGTQVDDVLAEFQPAYDLAAATDHSTCLHCGRAILLTPAGRWIDPEAGYDDENGDGIWRETCQDNHEDRIAAHEPGGA